MNVTVFSSTNCAVCHAEMQWLDQQGVKYDNVVIDESDDNMQKMIDATGGMVQGTPLTIITDGDTTEKIPGFDRGKLTKLLNLA